MAVLILNLSAG